MSISHSEREKVREFLRTYVYLKKEVNMRTEELEKIIAQSKEFQYNTELNIAVNKYAELLKSKIDELAKKTKQIDAVLEELSAEEREVIYLRYCKRLKWYKIAANSYWSLRALQKFECDALEKIAPVIVKSKI